MWHLAAYILICNKENDISIKIIFKNVHKAKNKCTQNDAQLFKKFSLMKHYLQT